ncbi:MAG: pyridoxal phosphate-dependent aminotransferase [Clostridiales bacterium]|jgi:cystathionine beta-lyase|nr:pyridoxal phosphate-dependent aminotransferase [Clostridiales bacterium]
MKKYNFDEIIDRRCTNSLKFDFAERRGRPGGLIPMWVADMDFKAPDEVIDALKKTAEHGIFGYSEPYDEYYDVLTDSLNRRFGWKPDPAAVVNTPGIVFALAAAVRAYTKEGDAVIIQPPVYYPFSEVVGLNGRTLVTNPLVRGDDGVYRIDFDDFETKIKRSGAKLFILCSPHNPVGRVFSKEELTRLGDICIKHGVTVVSDEIHSDFVYEGGKHIPFAHVKSDFAANSIICTSPAKTFNIAGLQFSDIIICDAKLREKFRAEVAKAGYSQLNTCGITAAHAAYKYGFDWLGQLVSYLDGNAAFICDYIGRNIPAIKVARPQGTYLAWLDMRALGLAQPELNDFIINKAGLWLDSGSIFGKEGEGFQRLNFGCPRSTVEKALKKLETAVANSDI